jgi:hypothetical protein
VIGEWVTAPVFNYANGKTVVPNPFFPSSGICSLTSAFKEVIVCQAGNAQIAGTPLKPMLTPTSVHHAKKNVNFSIIPAIPRIVLTKARITESVNRKPDVVVKYKLVDTLNFV